MKIETTKRDCLFFIYIGQQMFPVQGGPNYYEGRTGVSRDA